MELFRCHVQVMERNWVKGNNVGERKGDNDAMRYFSTLCGTSCSRACLHLQSAEGNVDVFVVIVDVDINILTC